MTAENQSNNPLNFSLYNNSIYYTFVRTLVSFDAKSIVNIAYNTVYINPLFESGR